MMSGMMPGPMTSGGSFAGMSQMPGVSQRLSNAMSADQATLTALAAAAAAAGQNPVGSMLASATSLPSGTDVSADG